ncbi:MAG: hypothetical protein HC769_34730 [Cyanobacteria bacterium CRU_2_1]|nr:hypothetical protein [Cyanobacteria bacterium CRU_2_1]
MMIKTALKHYEKLLVISSIILIFASLAVGCYVAWNRLSSFRNTTKIARQREKNQHENLEGLRKLVNLQDERTWLLLRLQAILFGLGSFLLLIAAIVKYLQQ